MARHQWTFRSGDRTAILTVAAFTILAAVLRFVGIGHQGFWFDEGNTALLVHFSPGRMLGLIPQSESTPPLYYCVAWVWARVFGYGEAGLRSLSALAGVATVPVAYRAARKLISERAGLIAAAMTACNPFLIWYSQEARSYSLLVLLTSFALLAFAYARATPTARALLVWVIASGLALGTHYYALLAIVPQAIWLLASHRRRRPVQIAVGVVGVCGLALIPLAVSQNGTGHASWIGHIAIGPRLGQIFPQFVIGTGSPAYDVLEPLGAAMVVIGLVLLALRSDPSERHGALAAGALAVGGLLLNLVLVAGGIDDLITRNVIVLWLPAAIAVAGGLGARRARAIGLCAAAVLCTTGLAAAIGVASDRYLQRPDWRAVARVLGSRQAAGTRGRVILVQHYRDLLPLSLYMPGLRFWRSNTPQTVSELDVVSIAAPRERLCWWGAACNLSPSQMQSSYPIAGFHEMWERRALQFTVMRLVASGAVALTPSEISGALKTTTLRQDELLIQR
jgi:4-amino-4-deoxy-L-arabinose transferase-like glycosyltransferase